MYNSAFYRFLLKEHIRYISKHTSKSFASISREMGYDESYLDSYLTNDKKGISLKAILKFCDVTGVYPGDLFPDDCIDFELPAEMDSQTREALYLVTRLSDAGRKKLWEIISDRKE